VFSSIEFRARDGSVSPFAAMDYGMDDFDLLDDQPSPFARWALPGLVASLLLHAIGLLLLGRLHFFEPPAVPEREPVTFQLERVTIDPEVLNPTRKDKPKVASAPQALPKPEDKPSFASMMAPEKGAPSAPKIREPLLSDKPAVDPASFQQTVEAAQAGGVKSVAADLDQVRPELEMDNPVSSRPLSDLVKPGEEIGGSPAKAGALAGSDSPGYSDLDALLAATGPLTPETAPIRMDSDVLYAYDSDVIQPQAIESLGKLGQIIQKNPQLIFAIEGHSDSDGDAAYNQTLSERRANSVKAWLVEVMRIDPAHITTTGYGETRLLVPATNPYSEDAEAPNRRVEIVLHDRPAQ
jgi:outer membrane protein OmpA-like peptidoglycan-associated protein